jgi:hypothetical protein
MSVCVCAVPGPHVVQWEVGTRRQRTLDDLVAFVDTIHSPRLVLGTQASSPGWAGLMNE